MHPQLGIWKRFIRSLIVVVICSLNWGFGRGLLEVYRGGQMQPHLGIWKRLIRSLSGVDRCSLGWGSGRGLLEFY